MNLDLTTFSPAERSTLQLRALYEQAGYRKYRMARFEEYALYQQYESFLPDPQVVTFTDLDGKLRAIRPDVTLSIAKNAQPAPGSCKKYYYTEQVCRPSRRATPLPRSARWAGMPGRGGRGQQAEVVRLARQSLNALGDSSVLELGHMGYVTAWLDGVGVAKADRPALLAMLQQKNPHGLLEAARAAGLPDADARDLVSLLELHGPLSATLAAARGRCRFDGQRAALEELTAFSERPGRGRPRPLPGFEPGRRHGLLQRPGVHRLPVRRGPPGAQGRPLRPADPAVHAGGGGPSGLRCIWTSWTAWRPRCRPFAPGRRAPG